jgi:putative transcriptional regulator
MAIRNNLKDIRYEFKMESGEFADFLNIRQPQYSRYENNKSQPNLETALHISKKINKPVNDIVYLVPDE